MKDQTIELVKRYYDAFNRVDWQGMKACLSDAVVHDVNQGGRREGLHAFDEFCQHMDRCYSEVLQEMVIMASDDGTRAAAEFVVEGTYKQTDGSLPAANGQRYRLPAGAFLAVHNGKITRVTTYYNLQDWIAQVQAA